MTKKLFFSIVLFFCLIIPAMAAGNKEASQQPSAEDGRLSVYVSIMPQSYFVQRIGGERVSVEVMVRPGRSPATYEPLPNQISGLADADVFFTIGVPFERVFLPKIEKSLADLKIVDTSEGIEKRQLEEHGHEGEEEGHDEHESDHDDHDADHEDEAGHDHGGEDPHVWLSPALVVRQAEIISETLAALDPAGASFYRQRFEEFSAELKALDTEIEEILSPFRDEVVFVFHPSFGYFTDRYGLRQVAVEIGGKEPSPAELEEIIEHAREEGAKIIFAQPEFSRRSIDAIAAAVGARVVVLNPLDPEYQLNLRNMADEIRKAYR